MMDIGSPEQRLAAAGVVTQEFRPDAPRGRLFGRLRVLSVADAFVASVRLYLLQGLIAPGELSVWWGMPKCGKSFLLLRIVYGLAMKCGMWGRKMRPCRVLYVAAEGETGFAARLIALRTELGDAGDAFQYIAQRAMVGPPSEDLAAVVEAAKAMRANVVVIDTLARTFGTGDESQTNDMGGFVSALDDIREQTGAHVAVIHHGPKDSSAPFPRGSIALVGAADIVVKVTKGAEGGSSSATIEECKDDESGAVLPFTLRVVDMGTDSDGNPRTTCIAEAADAAPAKAAGKSLTDTQRAWLQDLNDMMLGAEATSRVPISGMKPVLTLTREQVRDGFRVRGRFQADPHAPLTPLDRRRLSDTLNALRDRKKIGLTEHLVWLP